MQQCVCVLTANECGEELQQLFGSVLASSFSVFLPLAQEAVWLVALKGEMCGGLIGGGSDGGGDLSKQLGREKDPYERNKLMVVRWLPAIEVDFFSGDAVLVAG